MPHVGVTFISEFYHKYYEAILELSPRNEHMMPELKLKVEEMKSVYIHDVFVVIFKNHKCFKLNQQKASESAIQNRKPNCGTRETDQKSMFIFPFSDKTHICRSYINNKRTIRKIHRYVWRWKIHMV